MSRTLFFFWRVYFVFAPFFLSFLFYFVMFLFFLLSLELCKCSSHLFLSSRPRTGLATTYITGYMAEARSVNVKKNVAFRRKALFVNGVSELVKVAGM